VAQIAPYSPSRIDIGVFAPRRFFDIPFRSERDTGVILDVYCGARYGLKPVEVVFFLYIFDGRLARKSLPAVRAIFQIDTIKMDFLFHYTYLGVLLSFDYMFI
jgi:hypothetical protein